MQPDGIKRTPFYLFFAITCHMKSLQDCFLDVVCVFQEAPPNANDNNFCWVVFVNGK